MESSDQGTIRLPKHIGLVPAESLGYLRYEKDPSNYDQGAIRDLCPFENASGGWGESFIASWMPLNFSFLAPEEIN